MIAVPPRQLVLLVAWMLFQCGITLLSVFAPTRMKRVQQRRQQAHGSQFNWFSMTKMCGG